MENNYVWDSPNSNIGGRYNTVNNVSFQRDEELISLFSHLQSAVENAEMPEVQKCEAKECIDALKEENAREKPREGVLKAIFGKLGEVLAGEVFSQLIKQIGKKLGILVE